MKKMIRIFGAAALLASTFIAPALADGGSLVIASTQVPRHLN